MFKIVLPPELRRGPGYHEQPGCHCCDSCHVRRNPDTGPEYFCVLDRADIPLSPANLGLPYNAEAEDAYTDEITDWEAGRTVAPQGICSQFTSRFEDGCTE